MCLAAVHMSLPGTFATCADVRSTSASGGNPDISERLRFNAQVAQEPVEALLVAVVFLPAGEVPDVTLAPQHMSPAFRGPHHRIIQADREQNDLLACARRFIRMSS